MRGVSSPLERTIESESEDEDGAVGNGLNSAVSMPENVVPIKPPHFYDLEEDSVMTTTSTTLRLSNCMMIKFRW